MIVQLVPAGDLEIRGGKLRLCGGTEYLRLKLLARHQFWRGEWFRDKRLGFPWRELVFQAGADIEVIRSAYRQMLITTPGVLSVQRLVLTPDYAARALGIEFVVVGTEGTVTVGPGDDDFLIPLP